MSRTVLMVEPDELSRLLKEHEDRIIERLRPQMQVIESSITHKEAAAFLGISPDSLTAGIKKGYYPATIIHWNGKRKAYYRSELRAILNPTK